MTLPVGQISLSQVNTELSRPATQIIPMNDSAVRTLAGVGGSGTVISMQNLQGKSAELALTISSNTYNYNLYNAAVGAGWPGSSSIRLTINPGVLVGSTSTGAYALLVPNSLNPAPAVTIVNNGTIIGAGGAGGLGGSRISPFNQAGTPGAGGGNAVFVNRPTTITNNGVIAGGGGGGGGGAGYRDAFSYRGGGGGGGGAGFNGGSGGAASTAASPMTGYIAGTPGSPGNSSTGGGGGTGTQSGPLRAGPGGAGGGRGASGTSGNPPIPGGSSTGVGAGAGAGAYIVGSPFVTWPATGTRLGPAS